MDDEPFHRGRPDRLRGFDGHVTKRADGRLALFHEPVIGRRDDEADMENLFE
jgi:hypothetical protein